MSIKEHRLFIYKSNSEIIEATDSCLSFNFDAGSVTETGDLYADNPSKTLGIKLLNTNNKQYSPHYTKGKIKFVDTTMNLVSGTNIYNLPYETTLMIYDKSNKYHMLISQDKIRVNSYNGVETETINVRIAYLDITTNNALNYIDGQFSPLLQERARVTLYEDTVDYSFMDYLVQGNGTDTLTIYNTGTPKDIIIMGTTINFISKNYYEETLNNYFIECSQNYYKLTMDSKNFNQEAETNYLELSLLNYYELSQENYYKICDLKDDKYLKIISITKTGNNIDIKFNRVIQIEESVGLYASWKNYTEFLKFDGYINGAIESDLETVSFNCVDRAYDLMSYKVSSTSFRGYDSIATSDNTYETVEESIQITLTSNSCTTTYLNYLNLFALNDVVKIYNGQDYYECTISAITSSSMTLTSTSTIPNGTYTVYKVYNPSLALETFIQNCLNDVGLPYTLYLGTSLYEFAYLPKNDEMQYNDLWNFFQDILIKTGNILSFENINNNFELFYRKIPTTFGTSKYTISDRHILQGTTFSMTGENVRNSYYLKYSNYESGSYVDTELIVDDFTLSSYQGTIPTERIRLETDEDLEVNDIVRINGEYLEVREVISSGIYKLNKNASESGTFNLYLSGDSTNEYGLKRAYYELDSTSQIDTNTEATNFLNLVLAQTKYPISTYVVKLNGNDYDLYNYDTITVNSPRLSLFNETMFVQSVAYDNNGGQKTLTITLTKIMQTGKYKYKEMITERGLNSVVTTNKNTTNDVFPPPQKLVALDPTIDDLQDYNVYSYVSWNDFIGRTVAQWEIQYSTSSTFDTYETITQNTTSLKLFLKEQKLYYIRVRGVGKEQVKGQWATTTVDASKYLIENPIQNRTWYIRLFSGNDEVEYFSQFDKLGYTVETLNNAIDTIEIVPNDDKGIKSENFVLWNSRIFSPYPTKKQTGLNKFILEKFNKNYSENTGKNINFRPVLNGYYKLVGDSYTSDNNINTNGGLIVSEWQNMKGIGNYVEFRLFDCIFGLLASYQYDYIKNIENLNFIVNKNNYSSDYAGGVEVIFGSGSGIPYDKSLTTYKNINITVSNFLNSDVVQGFLGANRIDNCKVKGAYRGFVLCEGVSNCVAENSTEGFDRCKLMYKNLAINCTTKYSSLSTDHCCSSLGENSTYFVPANGGDTVNAGFNV